MLDAPKLVTTYWMFANTTEVVITLSDVSNVHEGQGMFYNCNNFVLANTSDNTIRFPHLTHGVDMFNGCNIRNSDIHMSFGADIDYLTNCSGMFRYGAGYDYNGNLSYLHLHDCRTNDVNSMFGGAKFGNVQLNRFDFTGGMGGMFNGTKVENIEIRYSAVRDNCYLAFCSQYDLNVSFDNV